MMKRLLVSPVGLALATALLAAPAVAQAPASPAAPAAPAPAAAPPTTTASPSAAPAKPAHTHAGKASAATHTQRVERLQTALNSNGATLTVDGKMGPKTSAALMAFQKAHGLKATGHVDKETIAALKSSS
jgi:peptidoglycan hydrolase-like protein with peptidoglycan-binding domain